jgi:hypothetical protein
VPGLKDREQPDAGALNFDDAHKAIEKQKYTHGHLPTFGSFSSEGPWMFEFVDPFFFAVQPPTEVCGLRQVRSLETVSSRIQDGLALRIPTIPASEKWELFHNRQLSLIRLNWREFVK